MYWFVGIQTTVSDICAPRRLSGKVATKPPWRTRCITVLPHFPPPQKRLCSTAACKRPKPLSVTHRYVCQGSFQGALKCFIDGDPCCLDSAALRITKTVHMRFV